MFFVGNLQLNELVRFSTQKSNYLSNFLLFKVDSPIRGQWLEVNHTGALIESQTDHSIHQNKAVLMNLGLCEVRIRIHGWMGYPPGDVLSTVVHNNSWLHGVGNIDEHIIASLGRRLINNHIGEQGLSPQDLRRKINTSHHSIRRQIHDQDLWRASDFVILQGSRYSSIQQPNAIAGIHTQAVNRSQDEIAAVEVTASCVGECPIGKGVQGGESPNWALETQLTVEGTPEKSFGVATNIRSSVTARPVMRTF